MKIVHINTYNNRGGAAAAAYRLHIGLRRLRADSEMLVRHKQSADDTVTGIVIDSGNPCDKRIPLFAEIQEQYINQNRTDISNTFFTLQYPGIDISSHPLVRNADLINLHWIAQFQSPVTINKLFASGKPVVWTLHDQWAFTGGCHYSSGCNKYVDDCSRCPQLADNPYDLTAAILKDKIELFLGANLTIVTPSHWLADCARNSRLLNSHRVESIPNSLDTDIFSPIPKPKAKAVLGIPPQKITILFGADNGNEKRKGFRELISALRCCLDSAGFQALLRSDMITILCAGSPSSEMNDIGIPVRPLGYLASDEEIRTAYSAADLFVLPSLEDNLPNTLLEAQSCGTPVIAFNTGGMPDVIIDGVTGVLVPPYRIDLLGETICSIVSNPGKLMEMGRKCRQVIMDKFSLETQAGRYLDFYDSLVGSFPSAPCMERISGEDNHAQDFAVPLNTDLGSGFRMIFDKVLFRSLNGVSPDCSPPSGAEDGPSASSMSQHSSSRKYNGPLPLISIVTPSFNQGQFLEECIDSVLGQNYPNLEYVIMDGGSTDNSVEIIKKYEKYLAYWQSLPDSGQYAAINNGFKKTSGEIMAWLNSDDKYHPAAFFRVAHIFSKYRGTEWIMGRPTVFDKESNIIHIFDYLPVFSRQKYLYEGYDNPHIQQESTFWRRSLWEKAGGMMRTDLGFAGDMELWVRFFRQAQLFTVDALLGGYRYHGNQKAILHMDKYKEEADKILEDEIDLIKTTEPAELLPGVQPISIDRRELREYLAALGDAKSLATGIFSYDADVAVGYLSEKIARMKEDHICKIPALESDLKDKEPGLGENGSADAEIEGLKRHVVHLTRQMEAMQERLNAVLSSRSWALTKPLRSIRRRLFSLNGKDLSTDDAAKKDAAPLTLPDFNAKTSAMISDDGLREIVVRYRNNAIKPLSYATVRDYCDSFDHMRPLAELNGDLKDVQRPWTLKTLLAFLPDSARVLEIGAGEPWIADILSRLGHEVWISDPYDGTGNGPTDYDRYRRECPDIRFVRTLFGVDALDLPPQYFDAIYSISVLEHVQADEQTRIFAGIRKYLNPRGRSIHCVDHVLKGNDSAELLHRLRRINILSGNTDTELKSLIQASADDTETYYLSAESHNRWRGTIPYGQFPMRICISVQFCSPHVKISDRSS